MSQRDVLGTVTGVGEVFAPGSVSLRLYPHNELDASGVVGELLAQAKLGLDAGFDGIMLSEHHGGFAGYLPNPLQMSAFILGENDSGWVAPCPMLSSSGWACTSRSLRSMLTSLVAPSGTVTPNRCLRKIDGRTGRAVLVDDPSVELVRRKLEHHVRRIGPHSPGMIFVVVLAREGNPVEPRREAVRTESANNRVRIGLVEEHDLIRQARLAHAAPFGGSGARASCRDWATSRSALSQTSQSSSKNPPA